MPTYSRTFVRDMTALGLLVGGQLHPQLVALLGSTGTPSSIVQASTYGVVADNSTDNASSLQSLQTATAQ